MAFVQELVRSHILRKCFKVVAQNWPWPVVARVHTGQCLFVDLRSSIGRSVLVTGDFDPAVSGFIEGELTEGDVFVDIGANVGIYAIKALKKVGLTGKVHAYEVDERALRCLRKSQRQYDLHNLVIHSTAVGECAGLVSLGQTDELGHTVVQSQSAEIQYPMLPLDAWIELFVARSPTLIKVDVEGSELGVLKGAIETLKRFRPTVICEIAARDDRLEYRPGELKAFMSSLGYKQRTLEGAHDPTAIFSPRVLKRQ